MGLLMTANFGLRALKIDAPALLVPVMASAWPCSPVPASGGPRLH
jgi:hypothetical protein